jgi:hypothetical protein
MAAGKPAKAEEHALEDAETRHGFRHVGRARRLETTAPGESRGEQEFIRAKKRERDADPD